MVIYFKSWFFITVLFFLHAYCFATQPYTTTKKKSIILYRQADTYYAQQAYDKAISLLHQAIQKDKKFVEAYIKLINIYQNINDTLPIPQLLQQAYVQLPNIHTFEHIYYNVAYLFYRRGEYNNAQNVVKKYLSIQKEDNIDIYSSMAHMQSKLKFALQSIRKPLQYTAHKLPVPINCFAAQYFPVLTIDQKTLLFTTRMGNTMDFEENIYVSYKDSIDNWTKPISISGKINTKANEGTCSISADGKTLIFTSSRKKNQNNDGICNLYISHKKNNRWTEPENLGPNINTTGWESQPSISADGKTLYFVSDRKENYGKKDIWKSEYKDGKWSKAVNLGPTINTKGQECAPFIHPNGHTLFFASNGRNGMGGFDIFYSNFIDSAWTEPINLGYPINNHKDQLSLFVTADGKKAYYADGQYQGNNYYNSFLYEFSLPAEAAQFTKSSYIQGNILTEQTHRPMEAEIEVYDQATGKLHTSVTSDAYDGTFVVVLNQGKQYNLYVKKKGFFFKSFSAEYDSIGTLLPKYKTIMLNSIVVGKSNILKHVFFDFDQSNLKAASKAELDQLVTFLQEHPEAKVEIEGHTDEVGTDQHNQMLSLKRAEAVYHYLIKAGIFPSRLTYQGYGKTKPLHPEALPEKQHQNRRTAYRVLQLPSSSDQP